MARKDPLDLSRRERQIMEALYRRRSATVAEVLAELPEPPTYSAVRALLRVLEDKGLVSHVQDGPRYVYRPRLGREAARRSAMRRLLATFFDGSVENAVAALIDMQAGQLGDAELDRLAALVEQAKDKGN